MDMVGCSLVFVVDAEKALKRAGKGFCWKSRALDTVFGGSRNMGFGFQSVFNPFCSQRTQFDRKTFILRENKNDNRY